MPLPEHKLEREFAILALTLYLQQYPDKASILALNYYEDYLNLADDFKLLRRDYEVLQSENIRLKSGATSQPLISLPSFVNSNQGAS